MIRVGDISIDMRRREVKIKDELIKLRTQEFELLRVMAEDPGRVFSRDQLLYLAWGYDFAGQNTYGGCPYCPIAPQNSSIQKPDRTVTGFG